MPRKSAGSSTAARYWLINTGQTGYSYDARGHQIGGGERILVPEVDAVGRAAIERGHLMILEADRRHGDSRDGSATEQGAPPA